MDETTRAHVTAWLDGQYDAATKAEIRNLQQSNPTELVDAFYKTLEFGTGGLRGLMGVGTNRLNIYTVRMAAQALANYIGQQPGSSHRVIIGYDCRHHSQLFAEEAARVLAANGIQPLLFYALRPCPLVSFGCRFMHCIAGIMITASHNPAQYNGFKVYWSDGAQVLAPHDKGIINAYNAITCPSQVKSTDDAQIYRIEDEVDNGYLEATAPLALYPEDNEKHGPELKIVYSSLHGTGITLVPAILERWGFSNYHLVVEQSQPDGDFSTVKSPNPEDPRAMERGVAQMLQSKADIFVATDPDADRVGIAVRTGDKAVLLNGNQIACLCLDHICRGLTKQERMPANGAFVKSIVTSELFKVIATAYGKPCFEVLPGFKYIGKLIREWEAKGVHTYLFGAEESYGYLLGTEARDKDAILTTALLCEIALQAKLSGKTLLNLLQDIYRKYGVYLEKQLSVNFPETKAGTEQMAKSLAQLAQTPPTHVAGISIVEWEDGEKGVRVECASGITTPLSIPKCKMYTFRLADNSVLIIRPSGTEPKIKIYCSVVAPAGEDVDATMCRLEAHASELLSAMEKMLKTRVM